MSTVLFAPDLRTADSAAGRRWLLAVATALVDLGHEVVVHPRSADVPDLVASLGLPGLSSLPWEVAEPAHADASGHLPRFRARSVLAAVRTQRADWVLAQGAELTRYLTGSTTLSRKLWAMPLDAPYRDEALQRGVLGRLSALSAGSHRLLVATESQRAVLEATDPSTTSRVVLMPTLTPNAPLASFDERCDDGGEHALEIDLDVFTESSLPDLTRFVERASLMRRPPRVILTGSATAPLADLPLWGRIPGLIRSTDRRRATADIALLPSGTDPLAHGTALDHALARGLAALSCDDQDEGTEGVLTVSDVSEILDRPLPAPSTGAPPAPDSPPVAEWFPAAPELTVAPRDRVKVVIAGADFKFAGDIVTALAADPRIDLRIDLFTANAKPQPEISAQYRDWADVVIAEFASYNALWYADNIRPDQKLIVHLHGYELLSDWIDDLAVDNCAAIVVASEFYRARALSMKDWPADLVLAIPNSVDPADLRREKFTDARFHLGFAGYVPILKRPDRALDLLRRLRAEDPRYVLHLRGHDPWNYAWEWKKTSHQDSYRRFYAAVGEDPDLLAGISFEPFGSDMGNWLRRVGWMLSPSYRETFHLAGVEGATSGAIPLVWERDGSHEIFSDRWNFASTQEVAEFVLATNSSADSYRAEAVRAMEFAERYSAHRVSGRWIDLVLETAARRRVETVSVTAPSTPDQAAVHRDVLAGLASPEERALLSEVDSALQEDDCERALEALDAGIPVTRTSTSLLKSAEQWVRGIAELDRRRFSLFLPRVAGTESPAPAAPLTVRRRGDTSAWMARSGLELRTVDVEPYAYTDPLETAPAADPHDLQPDEGRWICALPGMIRSDRWMTALAGEITRRAVCEGSDGIIARGPWWVALAAGLAADRLALPFTWVITQQQDVARMDTAQADPYGAGFIPQIALQVLSHCDLVVDETRSLAEGPIAPHLEAAQAVPGVAGHAVRPSLRATGYHGIPEASERSLEDLEILVAGSDDFVARWAETGAAVTVLTRESFKQPVPPSTDLVVVDGMLALNRSWRALLLHRDPSGPTAAAKLFDSARLAGARSLLMVDGLASFPKGLFATLRKTDALCYSTPRHARAVLKLHPNSIISAFPSTSDPDVGPMGPALLARSAGLTCTPPARPAPQTRRETADAAVPPGITGRERDEVAQEIDEDGISVVLATHRGVERIGAMLDALAAQTLPASRIQLIVVENGAGPDVETLVSEFGAATGIATVYRHLERADAGAARNVGLSQVDRRFVAFVDDDDELEPDYLLSLWLSADENTVVLGRLTDVHPDGEREDRTAVNTQRRSLMNGRRPLEALSPALSLNAAKLLPAHVATGLRFPEGFASGEDVVYMAQLLGRGLTMTASAPLEASAYLRRMRGSSISRQPMSFDFSVEQRLRVIEALDALRPGTSNSSVDRALTRMRRAQASFIKRYLADHPEERDQVHAASEARGLRNVLD